MHHKLRPHRITKPPMRRPAIVLFLAAAGALATAGIALASATSTSSFSMRCDGRAVAQKCPQNTFTKARLNIHAHTNYTNPGNSNPGGATKRIQIFFDNDFRFNPSATPRCDAGQLFNRDMAAAMANCGGSLIGSGTAKALAGSPPFTVNACALLFNGPNNADGDPQINIYTRVQASNPSSISCTDFSNNHQGNATVVLTGALRTTPLGDFSRELDIPNITSSSILPVTDLNLNLDENNDGVTSGYVKARCFDANHVWNVTAYFTYNDGTTRTVNSTRTCSVG